MCWKIALMEATIICFMRHITFASEYILLPKPYGVEKHLIMQINFKTSCVTGRNNRRKQRCPIMMGRGCMCVSNLYERNGIIFFFSSCVLKSLFFCRQPDCRIKILHFESVFYCCQHKIWFYFLICSKKMGVCLSLFRN